MKVLPKESLQSWIFHKICRHGLFWFLIVVFSAGCGIAVVGLHPEYPPLEKKTFAIYPNFVGVDSLQPTFRWQPFPRPEDHLAAKVQNVTY